MAAHLPAMQGVRLTVRMEVRAAERPDPAAYMRQVAALEQARAYKDFVVSAMRLRPGAVALDVGCGPGTDLAVLGSRVEPTGQAVGLDIDAAMATAAKDSSASGTRILIADSHQLPFREHCVDAARVDRALQHMSQPSVVLAELHRVLRPGSVVAVAEPDWGTLAVDAEAVSVSQAFTDYTCCEVVRNPLMGRQVGRLASGVGFVVDEVRPFPTVVRDFATADHVFGLTRNGRAAVAAGYLGADDVESWLDALRTGPLLVSVLLYVTVLLD